MHASQIARLKPHEPKPLRKRVARARRVLRFALADGTPGRAGRTARRMVCGGKPTPTRRFPLAHGLHYSGFDRPVSQGSREDPVRRLFA